MLVKDITDYFFEETELLKNSLLHFANSYPQNAKQIGIGSNREEDPYISRLIEANAYMHARIKQQIDLGALNVGESLLRHMAGQYLNPVPSMTVVEFRSPESLQTEIMELPAKVKLISQEVGSERTHCKWQTRDPVLLYPLKIKKSVFHLNENNSSLEIHCQYHIGVDIENMIIKELPIFINADKTLASLWFYNLTQNVHSIFIKSKNKGLVQIGDQKSLQPTGNSDHGFVRLQNYFSFYENNMFVTLTGLLDKVKEESFTIIINFKDKLTLKNLKDDLFKINCVVAQNVFSTTAEPIRLKNLTTRYPLIIDKDKSLSAGLYAILKVTGVNSNNMQTVSFADFYKLDKKIDSYNTYRLSSSFTKNGAIKYYLEFQGQDIQDIYISIDLLAHNGNYPNAYLGKGELKIADGRYEHTISATNLTEPTRFKDNKYTEELGLFLLSIHNINLRSLTDKKTLVKIFAYCWQNTQPLDDFSVSLAPFSFIQKGCHKSAIKYELKFMQLENLSYEEFYTFAYVFNEFLQDYLPINTHLHTIITSSLPEICHEFKSYE